MRAIAFLLVGVLCVAAAAGCGGDGDKKNVNKDKDRPVWKPGQKKAAEPPGPGEKQDRPGGV